VATARPKLNAKEPKRKQKLTEAQIAVTGKKKNTFDLPKNSSLRPISPIPLSSKNSAKSIFRSVSTITLPPPLGQALAQDPRHEQPALLEMVHGGKLNACYNCVDRHLTKYKNKAALIFVPEPEGEAATVITYPGTLQRVNEVAPCFAISPD